VPLVRPTSLDLFSGSKSFYLGFFRACHTTPLTPGLALNTAINFSTTTTWQADAGENTMSYVSQVAGLCAQNFMAGAAGLEVGIALFEGLQGSSLTNWVNSGSIWSVRFCGCCCRDHWSGLFC